MKNNILVTATILLLIFSLAACTLSPAPTPVVFPTAEQPTKPPSTQPALPQPTPEVNTPTVTAAPTDTTAPTSEAPGAADTPWPTVAPQPAAAASLPPGSPVQLDDIQMITLTDGWGISGGLLLKTLDGGRTWREVTPAGGARGHSHGCLSR